MSVQIRCNCGYRMELPDEWSGKQGRCPQCSKVLQISANKPTLKPVPTQAKPRASTATRISLDGRSAAPYPAASAAGPRSMFSSPMWLSIMAGGVALIGIGLFLVLRDLGLPVAQRTTVAAVESRESSADTQGNGEDVFRPNVSTQEPVEDATVHQRTEEAQASSMSDSKVERPTQPAAAKGSEELFSLDKWTLRDYGVKIPAAADTIEVDGVVLHVRNVAELAARSGAELVLPLGKHIVRFARSGQPQVVEPRRWFLDGYLESVGQVKENGHWNFDRLLELSRRTMDRFTEPIVPHLWGNFYWQEGQLDAAARQYVWALEIAPTFAPSYLNLALLSDERGDADSARRYLRMAELWNAQNAYGLGLAAASLRASLGGDDAPPDDPDSDWFTAQHSELSPRDRDMMAVLRSAAEFAPRLSERAKVLNNLGAYFEQVGKPEWAVENYRSAASTMGSAKLNKEESRVMQGILENLARVCRKADMPEYRRYERLQAMVQQ